MAIKTGSGYVYLVGAGPGDPGLLTIKGAQSIKKADVVVYDRLVGRKILEHAREDAELIYVGKSPERHTLIQEEINHLLVTKAKEGKIVTRLKGGDPFVFGRGGEEAEELKENNIPFEIIPGITSAIAVPAYAGIPVTHRDCTSTIGIITGNEDPTKGNTNIAWDKIATGMGTLIFLMGMAKLPWIVNKLIANGRAEDTPVALIRWGTRPEQKTLTGTLVDIVEKSQEAGFKNPAIIIVGEVVKLRDRLQWFENKPFFGNSFLVTRSREQASSLSSQIEDLGGEVMEFPTIEIAPPLDWEPIDSALACINKFQWIVFTSVNGVSSFFNRLKHNNMDVRDLHGIKLCAIGPKTCQSLEEFGLNVEYVPEEYVAEAVIRGLQYKIAPGDKILLPRADIARKVLVESLTTLGAEVTELVAYRTIKSSNRDEELLQMLSEKKFDIATFTSSSTVKNFVSSIPSEQLKTLLQGVKIACIGPITAKTAEEAGLTVDVVAKDYTVEGLVQAVLEYLPTIK